MQIRKYEMYTLFFKLHIVFDVLDPDTHYANKKLRRSKHIRDCRMYNEMTQIVSNRAVCTSCYAIMQLILCAFCTNA